MSAEIEILSEAAVVTTGRLAVRMPSFLKVTATNPRDPGGHPVRVSEVLVYNQLDAPVWVDAVLNPEDSEIPGEEMRGGEDVALFRWGVDSKPLRGPLLVSVPIPPGVLSSVAAADAWILPGCTVGWTVRYEPAATARLKRGEMCLEIDHTLAFASRTVRVEAGRFGDPEARLRLVKALQESYKASAAWLRLPPKKGEAPTEEPPGRPENGPRDATGADEAGAESLLPSCEAVVIIMASCAAAMGKPIAGGEREGADVGNS